MTLGIVWPERLAVILNISRKLYYTMFNRNALKFLWHCVIVLIVYVIGNRVLECPKWIWYLINKRPFDTAYLERSGWPLMWLIKLSTGSYKESLVWQQYSHRSLIYDALLCLRRNILKVPYSVLKWYSVHIKAHKSCFLKQSHWTEIATNI